MSETVFYQRVAKLCEERGISITKLADEIGKGSATASGWKKGSVPRSDTLRLIADYFEVSIEFLTGKTSISKPTVQTNNGAIGNFHAPVTISNGSERTLSANEIEMLRMFSKLEAIDQAKILVFTNELLEKKQK